MSKNGGKAEFWGRTIWAWGEESICPLGRGDIIGFKGEPSQARRRAGHEGGRAKLKSL